VKNEAAKATRATIAPEEATERAPLGTDDDPDVAWAAETGALLLGPPDGADDALLGDPYPPYPLEEGGGVEAEARNELMFGG